MLKLNVLEDPTKILWIHKNDFKHMMIGIENFVHNHKVYKTFPPYEASLELFRRKLSSVGE